MCQYHTNLLTIDYKVMVIKAINKCRACMASRVQGSYQNFGHKVTQSGWCKYGAFVTCVHIILLIHLTNMQQYYSNCPVYGKIIETYKYLVISFKLTGMCQYYPNLLIQGNIIETDPYLYSNTTQTYKYAAISVNLTCMQLYHSN